MAVSGVTDLTTQLLTQATEMSSGKVQQQITGSMLKKVLDQQEAAADSLVQMIKSGSLTGTGKVVDISA